MTPAEAPPPLAGSMGTIADLRPGLLTNLAVTIKEDGLGATDGLGSTEPADGVPEPPSPASPDSAAPKASKGEAAAAGEPPAEAATTGTVTLAPLQVTLAPPPPQSVAMSPRTSINSAIAALPLSPASKALLDENGRLIRPKHLLGPVGPTAVNLAHSDYFQNTIILFIFFNVVVLMLDTYPPTSMTTYLFLMYTNL